MTPEARFGLALRALERFCTEPIREERDVAGVLKGFEFTYETAWKAVQAAIADLGYAERGPRLAFVAAMRAGILDPDSGDAWSDLLRDRNLSAHTYRAEWAAALAERVRTSYLPLFQSLERRLAEGGASGAAPKPQ